MSKQPDDRKGTNDKKSPIFFEDNAKHERKGKYRSCIQGRKQRSRQALQQERKDNAEIEATFQSELQDESSLWDFRFAHLNFRGMELLHTKNMVK